LDIPPEVIAAKDAVELALLQIPGVVGVGLGFREEDGELFDELAVRIHLADGVDPSPELPEQIAGVAVSFIPGSITPCGAPDIALHSELCGGIKISKPSKGFGTMGAIVQDTVTGRLLGLSCFHVVGGTADVFPDTIWQPTNPPLVVGVPVPPDDNIGHVTRVEFPQTPTPTITPMFVGAADAAVFTLDEGLSHGRTLSAKILSDTGLPPNLVERISATAAATPGQLVRKRGFQTGVTTGFIIGAFTTFQWTAGAANMFVVQQLEIAGATSNPGGIFCVSGDSGSVVLDDATPTALGVLWGSKMGGQRGIMSTAQNVEFRLGVRFAF
jgi:hypothetical protein